MLIYTFKKYEGKHQFLSHQEAVLVGEKNTVL
jgi:hypothetical protein